MSKLSGVGQDTPVTKNERGGLQSGIPYACHLLPARAVLSVSAVLELGARKYRRDNWRNITAEEHVNHALTHALAWIAGDTQDDHMSHFACRALMALEMYMDEHPPSVNTAGVGPNDFPVSPVADVKERIQRDCQKGKK